MALLEDFTTYTVVEEDDRIQVTENHIDVVSPNDEINYVYADKEAGHFTDFEHTMEIYLVSGDVGAHGTVWQVSNIVADGCTLFNGGASEDFITVFFNVQAASYRLYLRAGFGGGFDQDLVTIAVATTYWITITRSGSDVSLDVYSDASRETLVGSVDFEADATTYRYIFPVGGYFSDLSLTAVMDVDDLDLQEHTEQGCSGSLTVTGTLGREIQFTISGSLTATGLVGRMIQFGLAGSMALAGAIVRKCTRDLGGGMTPTGDLTTKLRYTKAVEGAITPLGALSIFSQFLRSLAGGITPTGAITRKTAKSVGGGITPTGGVVKKSTRDLGGGVAPSGDVATELRSAKAVEGSLTPTGVVSTVCQFFRSLAGSITPEGTLTKILNPSGIVARLRTLLGVGQ